MEKLNRIHRGLLIGGLSVGGAMIALMGLLVSLDILIRQVGLGGLPWVVEVSEYFLFLSTFLAAPWVLNQGGHVRVDLLITILPPPAARMLHVFANLTGLAVSAVLVIYGVRVAIEAFQLNSLIFKQLVIPEWWLLVFIPFTGALLLLEFFLFLLQPGRGQPDVLPETAGQIQDGF